MSTYYKILPRRYAEDLVHRGEIKIKTLFECRAAEDIAGKGRSDDEEGMVGHEHAMPSFRALTDEEASDIGLLEDLYRQGYRIDPYFLSWGIKQVVRVVDTRLIRPGLDVYLLCVSREQTRESECNLWEPGEESCWVEICDGERFFAALNSHMATLGHVSMGVRDVTYRSRVVAKGEAPACEPAWIKPASFAAEHETRAVWRPGNYPIKWFVPKVPELTAYCRIQKSVDPP